MKKVKRTYTNKKGQKVTKTYTYNKKYKKKQGGRNLLLVNKQGKIYTDRVQKLIDQLDPVEDFYEIQVLKGVVQGAKMKGEVLKTRKALSILASDRYVKMFINAGYSIEEAADMAGTTVDELTDSANWNGDTFTNPSDFTQWQFKWTNYEAGAWEQI